MKSIIIAVFIFASFFDSQAETKAPLVRFQDKETELYGYKDLGGKIVIPAQYQYAETETFREAAIVTDTNNRTICIDRSLKVLFEPFQEDNTPDNLESGSVRVIRNGKIGFADASGREFIPPIYDYALPFSGEFAAFYSGGTYGSLDGLPDSQSEHFGWTGGLWGIINKNNDTIIPPQIDDELIQDLDIAGLTDKDPNSSSFAEFNVGGKRYFIENVIHSFEIFLEEFIPKAAEANLNYFRGHSMKVIDCTECLRANGGGRQGNESDQAESENEEKEYQSAEISIDDFIKNNYNTVFAKDSMTALLGNRNCFIVCQYDEPRFLSSLCNVMTQMNGLDLSGKYFELMLVVNHFNAGGKQWQERYSFIKTSDGYKFAGYAAPGRESAE